MTLVWPTKATHSGLIFASADDVTPFFGFFDYGRPAARDAGQIALPPVHLAALSMRAGDLWMDRAVCCLGAPDAVPRELRRH
jgi:hypothetical protein